MLLTLTDDMAGAPCSPNAVDCEAFCDMEAGEI